MDNYWHDFYYLEKIQKLLIEILTNSPSEEYCTKLENRLLDDIANVVQDIEDYYDTF